MVQLISGRILVLCSKIGNVIANWSNAINDEFFVEWNNVPVNSPELQEPFFGFKTLWNNLCTPPKTLYIILEKFTKKTANLTQHILVPVRSFISHFSNKNVEVLENLTVY